jgi:hypothetical protein
MVEAVWDFLAKLTADPFEQLCIANAIHKRAKVALELKERRIVGVTNDQSEED